MATVTLTGENFWQTVRGNGIVLIDFWAEWCGPCKRFAPVFERASDQHPDIIFGKVDTEAEQELATAARILSIPTLFVFREGICLLAQPGAMPEGALTDLIGRVRDIDMEDLRQRIVDEDAERKRREP